MSIKKDGTIKFNKLMRVTMGMLISEVLDALPDAEKIKSICKSWVDANDIDLSGYQTLGEGEEIIRDGVTIRNKGNGKIEIIREDNDFSEKHLKEMMRKTIMTRRP